LGVSSANAGLELVQALVLGLDGRWSFSVGLASQRPVERGDCIFGALELKVPGDCRKRFPTFPAHKGFTVDLRAGPSLRGLWGPFAFGS